jgi:hypothetical protein
MALTNFFPRPQLGDVFVRRNLNGNEEEAMILSVQYSTKAGSLWQATMNTKNGIEFVTGDAEHRNIYDWRPQGWVFDDANGNWYSPADKAKIDAGRAAEAAKVAVAEPETKDEFLVADASEITNAMTRKRGLPPKLPAPQLPQV